MSIKTTYFLMALLWMISYNSQNQATVETVYNLVEHQQEYIAGESIVLKFNTIIDNAPDMVLSYNNGSTLLIAQSENKNTVYKIPEFIGNLAGYVSWNLVNTKIKGDFTIIPYEKVVQMETYAGPPSLIASKTDYSMVVSIPLDTYDNPMPDSTSVNFNYNKEDLRYTEQTTVKDMIAFDYVYSHIKTGNILLASNSGSQFSKEFTIEIHAGLPVDFTLSRKRNHNYADGNQLVTFYTSIIKDSYKNVVNDGTLVTFYITTGTGTILQTTGTTIKGIATATMIHPEKEESWSVNATVAGMATSDVIDLKFEPAFNHYEVAFNEKNKSIKVGPLRSFMGQVIPDGLTVKLKINGNSIEEEYIEKSYKGSVVFELNLDLIPNGIYNFEVTAGGITRKLKNVAL